MNIFFREFFKFLFILYAAELVGSLLSDEVDRWTKWGSVDLHLGLWMACLILAVILRVYDRINKKIKNNGKQLYRPR